MTVAGLLPREDNAITLGPEELVVGVDTREDATWAFSGPPQFMASSGLSVGETDGPGLATANGAEAEGAGGSGNSNKGDLAAIGRPDRVRIAIYRGIEIAERLGTKIVDADESVVGTANDVSDACAIRRPAELARGAFGVNQLIGFVSVFQADRPEFVLAQEDKAVA